MKLNRYLRTKVIPYIRTTLLPARPVQLLIQTGLKWSQDDCPGMAASLSYFALFSLFPILLIVLSIVGQWISPDTDAFLSVQNAIRQFFPPEVEVYGLVRETVIVLNQNSVGAGLVGIGVLIWTSTAVFATLRSAVNKIWRSPPITTRGNSVPGIVFLFAANRLLAFVLVLGVAGVLLASLISNLAIRIILELVTTFGDTFAFLQIDESQLTWGLQAGASILILTFAFGILFKILPAVVVLWKDVWLGGLLTAFMLIGLQQLVSNSVISIGSRFLSYGVIGSVMILLFWIFLTFQIILLGCVFTYIYAHLFGSRRHRASRS